MFAGSNIWYGPDVAGRNQMAADTYETSPCQQGVPILVRAIQALQVKPTLATTSQWIELRPEQVGGMVWKRHPGNLGQDVV